MVSGPTQSFFDSPCKGGCTFQRIDVPTRTIVSQQSHVISDLFSVVRTAGDPTCGQVIVGYTTPSVQSTFEPGGFRLQSFTY